MIIGGRSRQNGAQLGRYLEARGENESVTPLEVRGTAAQDVRRAVLEMSLAAELNARPGKKALYHAHLAPDYDAQTFTPEQWTDAADRLEKALGLDGQARVLVLHEKKGKVHCHVVWQRSKDGRFISDSGNYRKHDQVRGELEQLHGHERTRQPTDHKAELTRLWAASRDGAAFVKAAQERGYTVAKGDRRPYVVNTPDGQRLDLVRQLQGVKTKEARERLASIERQLVPEADLSGSPPPSKKERHAEGRQRRAEKEKPVRPKREKVSPEQGQEQPPKAATRSREELAKEAGQTLGDMVSPQPETDRPQPSEADRIREAQERTRLKQQARENMQSREDKAQDAGQTLDDITGSPESPMEAAQRRAREKRQRDRDHGRELDRD